MNLREKDIAKKRSARACSREGQNSEEEKAI
jgi:hypothetical protein